MKREGAKEREKEGIITAAVGLVLNLILGGGKLAVGILSGSVAIMTDAVNNLSDAGTGIVTISSFLLSSKKADREHPYGHGRYEYIASFLIGVVIVMVGFEFALTSVEKIIAPSAGKISLYMIIVLAASIAVKAFMAVFYKVRNKKVRSGVLKAAAFDSFSDCLVTASVLICLILQYFFNFNFDGIVGLLVSAVIIVGGIKVLLETINRLLGVKCDDALKDKLNSLVMCNELIVGTHDLKVHDYGSDRIIASVHAEFIENISILEAHGIIDGIEHAAYEELHVELVVHCDPIDKTDIKLNRLRHSIGDVLRKYENAKIHDLDYSLDHHAVEFHLSLPERYMKDYPAIETEIRENLSNFIKDVALKITVDCE